MHDGRQDDVARPGPLIVVHGVLGQIALQVRLQLTARRLALGSDPAGVGRSRGDQRLLPLPLKQRQAYAGAHRDHVAERGVAPLIAGLDRPVRTPSGPRQVELGLGPPILGLVGLQHGQDFKAHAQGRRIRRIQWRRAVRGRGRIAGPSGQHSARGLSLGDQTAAPIVQRRLQLDRRQGHGRTIRPRRHPGRRGVPKRLKRRQDLVHGGQLATRIIEIDPGQARRDPHLAQRRGVVGHRHADGGLGQAALGATARPAGQLLLDADPQGGEVVFTEPPGHGPGHGKAVQSEFEAWIGQPPGRDHGRTGCIDAKGAGAQIRRVRRRAGHGGLERQGLGPGRRSP